MRYAPCEPTLDDLLHDDIAHLLMTRDGITETALRQLLRRVQPIDVDRSGAPTPWRVERREAVCRENALASID